MTNLTNIPGLYGKIPSLGDFVSRRLTACFIEIWDHWLQHALTASKNQLGDNWLDSYLTSPIWCFLLSPNICGAAPWAGILIPSVDKVGRYFPLTFAVSINATCRLPELFMTSADWFAKLEQLALETLEDELDPNELDRRLQASPLLVNPITRHDNPHITYIRKDNRFCLCASLDNLEQINTLFAQMGIRLITESHFTYSLWMTTDANSTKNWIRIYNHLPPWEDFSELLTCPPNGVANDFVPGVPPALDHQESTVVPHRSQIHNVITHPRIQWHSFGATTVGKYRKTNEDAFLERPKIGLWAVADGMGGHSAGDKASKAVVDALGKVVATGNLESFVAYATECLKTVNTHLLEMASQAGRGQIIGTTVIVMLAVGDRCAAIWAGDSRLYQIRDGMLTQLTKDHGMFAGPSRQDEMSIATEDREENENVITRALGAEPEVDLEVIIFQAKVGDVYLLCSDGLVKEVKATEVEVIMNQQGYQAGGKELIEIALERGARDNVTVVTAFADRAVV